ncbi:MAG TPA: response regulator transcription factor [Ilumatobacteraceae bacterium]|nr:response regulator transcription factor [Ilumatobacteraceae bacterium]
MSPTDGGRVLVVEDDDAVRSAVDRGLGVHGFDVSTVPDAESALTSVARHRPDLMIVDVGLPGMSGIELCTRLRVLDVDTPILILSARDQVGDRVAGLQAGADDYLVKPFSLDELAARLHALLRRARPTATPTTALAAGPLWIDLDRRVATVDDVRLDLSRREFDLLATFAANPGIVLSRVRLLELVWGYDFDVDTNVVDVFVGYLRRKLEAAGDHRLIDTVRGVGFVLRAG